MTDEASVSSILSQTVTWSLQEDLGSGDITAQLLPRDLFATAQIITREAAIICGIDWVNEVYHQLDPGVKIQWAVKEGDRAEPNQLLASLEGRTHILVTGERCALNWLQTLSATATQVAKYLPYLEGTKAQLLDTRKTIPGLRYAQKYAVRIGGGKNHRLGLYDAYLIKENHILACGGITAAIQQARKQQATKTLEIEVESLAELQEALSARADIIMLDNFTLEEIRHAVLMNNGQAKLEASGNINLKDLKALAETGIDYISVGALTKHIQAIDLSMRITTLMD